MLQCTLMCVTRRHFFDPYGSFWLQSGVGSLMRVVIAVEGTVNEDADPLS